jgi:V/A-type H+-transporting ATPase subunit D
MPAISVAPTRTNLIRVKKDLRFAREGHEILDRKREVLISELVRVAHEAEAVQKEVWELLASGYAALQKARLTLGSDRVEWAALAASRTVDVHVKYRGIMGVAVPVIDARGAPPQMLYSLGDTNAALDEASSTFREILVRLPQLSMLVTTVWRLAGELRKTQRRVNALQHIFIPNYEATVAFIVSSLEEREREEIFRLKWLKNKLEQQKTEAGAGTTGSMQPASIAA